MGRDFEIAFSAAWVMKRSVLAVREMKRGHLALFRSHFEVDRKIDGSSCCEFSMRGEKLWMWSITLNRFLKRNHWTRKSV